MVRLVREAQLRKTARRQRSAAEQRARSLGFTEAQVPFIASSYLMLSVDGRAPTVREVVDRVRGQMPWLLENPAQGELWDDDAAFVDGETA